MGLDLMPYVCQRCVLSNFPTMFLFEYAHMCTLILIDNISDMFICMSVFVLDPQFICVSILIILNRGAIELSNNLCDVTKNVW